MAQYKNQIAPPMRNANFIKNTFTQLEQLREIEAASKILLGALYRQSEVHPVDYIYQALNIDIEHLPSSTAEYEAIAKYIKSTQDSNINYDTHKVKLFKVERKGEAEKYEQFRDVTNHRLLFHGSKMFNFVGILKQGLRIAPPEAPATGYMFGKGLYFADMYAKSAQYSQMGMVGMMAASTQSTLLMLCDVALGKMQRHYEAKNVEKLPAQFKSVHGVGRRGPNYDNCLIHPEG